MVWYAGIGNLLLLNAAFDVKAVGWLDKVVAYYKNSLLTEMGKLSLVQINVTIQSAPPGYVDIDGWNVDTVSRLMTIMQQIKASRPAFQAIRRALQPTLRAGNAPKKKLYEQFPSLGKFHPNVFYHSFETDESEEKIVLQSTTTTSVNNTALPDDNNELFISKPVEARLPSAMITVGLLRYVTRIITIHLTNLISQTT